MKSPLLTIAVWQRSTFDIDKSRLVNYLSLLNSVAVLNKVSFFFFSTCSSFSKESDLSGQSKWPMICRLRGRPLSMTVNLMLWSWSSFLATYVYIWPNVSLWISSYFVIWSQGFKSMANLFMITHNLPFLLLYIFISQSVYFFIQNFISLDLISTVISLIIWKDRLNSVQAIITINQYRIDSIYQSTRKVNG